MADKSDLQVEQEAQNTSSLSTIAEALDTIAGALTYFVNLDKSKRAQEEAEDAATAPAPAPTPENSGGSNG